LTVLWDIKEFLWQFVNGDLRNAIVGLSIACILNLVLLASALFRANKIERQLDELQQSIQALTRIEVNRLRNERSKAGLERPIDEP
jgi:hypothetical protein